MRANQLFQTALQLEESPWRVVRTDFSGQPPALEIGLEFVRGSQFHCPQCGELCGVHDTVEKRWRHLNFFQYRCELLASVPRVWCQWATRSRLAPFKKLAQTFRQYWAGIVSYFQCRITQGAIEAINGIIQLAKRRARRFRNFLYLRTIAYWVAGQLKANLPSYLPT